MCDSRPENDPWAIAQAEDEQLAKAIFNEDCPECHTAQLIDSMISEESKKYRWHIEDE